MEAGLATKEGLTSQLGHLITFMDDKGNLIIVHYGSIKARRVTRSVLADELFAMTQGFDFLPTICLAVKDIIEQIVPMKFYTD